ncbi:hypothetical protein D3C85_891130 [compost metagenome]
MAGSKPTITNSVVSTVKPAADSNRMGKNMNTPENDERPGDKRRPSTADKKGRLS